MRLANKVAIVTGAGTGNGRGIALGFAREGADVVAVDWIEESARVTAGEIQGLGRRALAVRADVSRSAEIKAMVEAAVAEFGRIDVLVNNAGIRNITPLLDITEEEWDQHLNIDLKGPFLATQEVAKQMIRQGDGGSIINITSVASEQAVEGRGHYCSAKGGLKMLTKVAALELARYGIRVNAIAPGAIETNMMAPVRDNPRLREAFGRRIPIGRWGQPEDLVGAAVFLACDDSAYVTGINLLVDGGHMAGPPAHGEAAAAQAILAERTGGPRTED